MENYLTESFVFLIKLILERDEVFGLDFLKKLCGFDEDDCFSTSESISISTQVTVEEGRPDIEIRDGGDKLIYGEIKQGIMGEP